MPKRGIYDSDSDDLSLPDGNDDSDAVEEDVSGIEAIRETLRSDRRDEYDDDFVDDEEEGTIGAPLGLEDIPIEFTRHAHKGMIEHFKDAVEWMVHNKLNPAFPRDDPLYRTAFRRLDDIVKGYTASKFVSAAWNPKFVRALQSRPIFYDRELPIAEGDKCDACNRSGHPAKFQVQFGGKSYHRENLEDVSDASEDESDEDDAKSHDSQGRSIPDSETLYFVGRYAPLFIFPVWPLMAGCFLRLSFFCRVHENSRCSVSGMLRGWSYSSPHSLINICKVFLLTPTKIL